MMNKFKLIITIIFFLSLSPSGYAFDLGLAKDDAGQSGTLFDFAASVRSLAMGQSHVAIADDASASYWNPAGLQQLKRKDLVTMYSVLEEESGYGFLSFANPSIDWGTIAVSIVNLQSKDFQKRDINGVLQGSFDQSEIGVLLSHGMKMSNRLSFGTSIKGVRQKIDTRDDVGFGLDLGLLMNINRKLKLGMTGHNLVAPKLKLDETEDTYERMGRIGLAFQPSNEWTFSFDTNKSANRSFKFRTGLEWNVKQVLALRAGIKDTELTAGLGFNLGDWGLDYAFGYQNAVEGVKDLGGSHRFGFRLTFGGDISEERFSVRRLRKGRKMLQKLAYQMDSPNPDKMSIDLIELKSHANHAIEKGSFIKPEDLYQTRGYLYYLNGNYEKSVQALGEAVELTRGQDAILKRHHKKALARMSRERTNEIVAQEMESARTHFEELRYKESLNAARKVLKFQPENEEAAKFLKEAETKIKEPIEKELKLAKKLIKNKRYWGAMNHLLKVKELDPENKEAAGYMRTSLAALKKESKANYNAQKTVPRKVYATDSNPQKSQELYHKGLLFYSQGKLEDALVLWENAVDLDKNNTMAKNAVRRVMLEIKEKN